MLAGGVILQVAFALLTDRQRREMLQTSAPVTACLLSCTGWRAAFGQRRSGARRSSSAESTALLAEPWRVLSCMVCTSGLPRWPFTCGSSSSSPLSWRPR